MTHKHRLHRVYEAFRRARPRTLFDRKGRLELLDILDGADALDEDEAAELAALRTGAPAWFPTGENDEPL